MSADLDARLRREAMAWLTVRTHDGLRSLSTDELRDFIFDGEAFRLMDAQRGIRKPRQLSAALSIRTSATSGVATTPITRKTAHCAPPGSKKSR